MSGKMTLYHELVLGANWSAYWAFDEKVIYRCDHCEEEHVESRRYIVSELFCPNPDCTCREFLLTVIHLDDAHIGTPIASAFLDLDEIDVSKITWNDVVIKHALDRRALQGVEERLTHDAGYRRSLEAHWSNVRASTHTLKRRRSQKQRKASLRRALAGRRRRF